MQKLYCKKCNTQTDHIMRVWNNIPSSYQIQGHQCKKCLEWRDEKKKPMTKDFYEKVMHKRSF